MSDWKELLLGQVINLKRGYDLPKRLREEGEVPIYSSSGISGCNERAKVQPLGVVTGRYGTIGKIFLAKTPFWPLNTTLYVQDFKGNDPVFIYYFLKQVNWEQFNDKSAVPGINRNDVHQEIVKIPEREEQEAIAAVLSSLDDKIDLLHRQNKTLEAMAQTLFRHWFVDGASAEWEKGTLGDFISIKHGYAFKGKFISTEPSKKILVTPGNFQIGGGFKEGKMKYYHGDDFPDGYEFMAGDLIVTMTDLSKANDTLGYPAFIPENEDSIYLHNQRVGKVLYKFDISRFFLYFLMRTREYRYYILGTASGTSVSHTSPTSICNYKFLIPPKELVEKFDNIVNSLYAKIFKNQVQIRTLGKLRDTLLPKLMSGAVRVKF